MKSDLAPYRLHPCMLVGKASSQSCLFLKPIFRHFRYSSNINEMRIWAHGVTEAPKITTFQSSKSVQAQSHPETISHVSAMHLPFMSQI